MGIVEEKFILDACCGPRHMWFNKHHPNTLYIDIRKEEKGFIENRKNCEVNPDILADFRDLPMFEDKKFRLIVWDPPYTLPGTRRDILYKEYGCLQAETWQSDLKKGFKELWRVLDDFGVLIFKWNNHDIGFNKLLKLFPVDPLFGQRSNKKSVTKWFCFMKIPK